MTRTPSLQLLTQAKRQAHWQALRLLAQTSNLNLPGQLDLETASSRPGGPGPGPGPAGPGLAQITVRVTDSANVSGPGPAETLCHCAISRPAESPEARGHLHHRSRPWPGTRSLSEARSTDIRILVECSHGFCHCARPSLLRGCSGTGVTGTTLARVPR